MLEAAEIDALISAVAPRAYLNGSPQAAQHFPDVEAVERDYYRWATRQELRIAIITWIERTYYRRRRRARLGRLTPIEYKTIMTKAQALAA